MLAVIISVLKTMESYPLKVTKEKKKHTISGFSTLRQYSYTDFFLFCKNLEMCAKMVFYNFSYRGRLECLAETVLECIYPDKLWEIYHLTEMIVYTSGICAEEPLICSPVSAVNCISALSQKVTHFNPMEEDEKDICS